VIVTFADQGTEDIFYGKNSATARPCCSRTIWNVAHRKLDQQDSSINIQDLRVPPGNHLEGLSGDRKGQHSIRIYDQYRICFVWTDAGPDEVEIIDYHKG
jgi:proteic killer suppression protein